MNQSFPEIFAALHSGEAVPYLGPGVLSDVREIDTGEPMPVEGEALILAMNKGRPMSPRLMYEFSRAAMQVEQRRGRPTLERFLTRTYGERRWNTAELHEWLGQVQPNYVVDINRDTQLLNAYADRPHLLVTGTARMIGDGLRFRLFWYDSTHYHAIGHEDANWTLPILFKPLGAPLPEPNYIASDADFVDYITELMGGFAIPPFLKTYRQEKKYLLLGMRFTRDTERMVYSEIAQDAAARAGWALIESPTPKERRFCDKKGLQIIEASGAQFLEAARRAPHLSVASHAPVQAGC